MKRERLETIGCWLLAPIVIPIGVAAWLLTDGLYVTLSVGVAAAVIFALAT